jgi:tRNA A-37 threonylcarbamoyl transferase component Bud32
MRLHIAKPGEHVALVDWPYLERLDDWTIPGLQEVAGLHRHVVRLVESGATTYVVKELPDHLAEREWRLLRELDGAGLPTAEVVGVVTERDPDADGLLITRNIDYSLPYRVLLSGRGLQIPYLGERVLDALAGLLVRLHLAGFYWGDCSLSNTLFRRDAGALSAYIIDVETGESHPTLSDGQRQLDLSIATENVAGDLEDLQAGGRLAEGIDPISTALAIEETYQRLWSELTGADEFDVNETFRIDLRLQRLHELGFDAAELELYTTADGSKLRLIPRVVEHGFHGQRLRALTGLETGENQARRLLNDISRYRAVLERQTGRKVPETMAAARWLDERFEPTIDGVPPDLVGKLEPAELYHQVLEHLWFMSEAAGGDVGLGEAVTSYVRDVLTPAPHEQRPADKKWADEDWDEINDEINDEVEVGRAVEEGEPRRRPLES